MRATSTCLLTITAALLAGCSGGQVQGVLGQPDGPCDETIADVEDDLDAHGNQLRAFVEERYASPVELEELERDVARIDGVRSTHLITKDEALARAERLFEHDPDVMRDLPGNPFPASVEISAERDRVDSVISDVEALTGIEEVMPYASGAADLVARYRDGEDQDSVCARLDRWPEVIRPEAPGS